MSDERMYNEVKGNRILLYYDGTDYEVTLNDMIIISTGDEFEAELVAESLDAALTVLDAQGLLNKR